MVSQLCIFVNTPPLCQFPVDRIEKAILLIRGQEVMLDAALADLYAAEAISQRDSALTLGRGSAISAGVGGNRPGIPACCPGTGFSKSNYRAAELDSGCFPSSGSRVRIPPGTPRS